MQKLSHHQSETKHTCVHSLQGRELAKQMGQSYDVVNETLSAVVTSSSAPMSRAIVTNLIPGISPLSQGELDESNIFKSLL